MMPGSTPASEVEVRMPFEIPLDRAPEGPVELRPQLVREGTGVFGEPLALTLG